MPPRKPSPAETRALKRLLRAIEAYGYSFGSMAQAQTIANSLNAYARAIRRTERSRR